MDTVCSCSTISKIRDKCPLHGWDLHVNLEVPGKVEQNDRGDNSFVSLGNNLQLVLVVMTFKRCQVLWEEITHFVLKPYIMINDLQVTCCNFNNETEAAKDLDNLIDFRDEYLYCIKLFEAILQFAHPSFSNILSADFFKSRHIHNILDIGGNMYAAYTLEVGLMKNKNETVERWLVKWKCKHTISGVVSYCDLGVKDLLKRRVLLCV
uniref:Gamma-tubulin complex component 3 n=1 Tax=Tanacetum cinerariifolium TaxID=118510 RepID=A0A6L2LNS0_TANCI|nr:gamma-tubulin complex component 3 [Tanacetum cinerariifolium]